MATIDQYKISIEVSGTSEVKATTDAVTKLDDKLKEVQDDLKNVGGAFMNFAAAAAAALGAIGVSAIRSADEMVDLANATGISAAKIWQLGEAAEANGGKFDGVGTMLGKFSNFVDQAASGTEEAVEAFKKLGISKEEFESLSDEQLFMAFIQGLGSMDKGLAQTSLAMKALGKDAKSIDFAGFANDMRGAADPALEANLQLAADAVGSLETAFRTFQKIALQALEPVLQAVKDFELTADDAKTVVKVLGALIAGAFSAKVVGLIIGAVNAVRTLSAAIKAAGVAQAFLTALVPGGAILVASAAAAAGLAYFALGKYLDSATEKSKALGEQAKQNEKEDKKRDSSGKVRTQEAGKTQKAMEQQALAARQVTDQMIRQNDEANQLRQIAIDTIGMESDRANLIQSNARAEADSRNKIADLDAKITAERAKGKDTNAAVIVELQKQKDIISGQLQETLKLNQAEYQRLQLQKMIKADNEFSLDNISLMEESMRSMNELRQKSLVAQGKLTEEQANRQIALFNLTSQFAEKEQRLKAQIADATTAQDEAEEYRLRSLLLLEKDRYDNAKHQLEQLDIIQQKLNDSMSAGAVAAFGNIAKQFENYKMAQDAIMMGWNKIGSAVDDFVETGKFKFSDFARSVIADLSKMIIKALLFKAIESSLGAFGIKLPGLRANGGPVGANQPYIVGEKGPELFVPKNAGSIIPNNKIAATAQATGTGMVNAPVTNNYITNNIQAVDAKSVAQLFVENRKTLLGTVQMAQKEMPYAV